jgi:hypothetical protein
MGATPLSLPELQGLRRAAGRTDLPVLCLAGAIEQPTSTLPDHVTLIQYPVSLDRLAGWIAHLPSIQP